ncbi:MAG: hypothetical protein H6713_20265 [Myxococcales bacterium]|nr:hypothetical protein [Myxococcales bacterium]
MAKARGILFVYDADLSLASVLAEIAHRTVRPDTYVCNLCKVTYGALGMKRAWSRYVKGLRAGGLDVDFALRSGFRRRHPDRADDPLPALYERSADARGGLRRLVGAGEFNAATTVDELQALVEAALERAGLLPPSVAR